MIAEGSRVSMEYTLTLSDGTEVANNVGEEPLIYSHGKGEILPKLEAALDGMSVGDEKVVELTAVDGYGEIDQEAYRECNLEDVPEDGRQVGAYLTTETTDGVELTVRVYNIDGDTVTLDFNHPLAGQDLTFAVKIVGVD